MQNFCWLPFWYWHILIDWFNSTVFSITQCLSAAVVSFSLRFRKLTEHYLVYPGGGGGRVFILPFCFISISFKVRLELSCPVGLCGILICALFHCAELLHLTGDICRGIASLNLYRPLLLATVSLQLEGRDFHPCHFLHAHLSHHYLRTWLLMLLMVSSARLYHHLPFCTQGIETLLKTSLYITFPVENAIWLVT